MSSSQMMHFCFGCATATTGPCTNGNGGVFLSLCSMLSSARQTFLPSNFPSIENRMNSAFPLILFEATPPPALPASSPVLMLKFESLTHAGLPSHLTFDVPLAVSEDFAMFGYGIGTGPAGDGVLQTSGNAVVMPLLSAWTTDNELTPTLTPILSSAPSVDADGSAFDFVRLRRASDDVHAAHDHRAVAAQHQ